MTPDQPKPAGEVVVTQVGEEQASAIWSAFTAGTVTLSELATTLARHRQNALAAGAGWRAIATFDSEPHGQANRVLIACGPIVGEAWYRDSDGANDSWDNGWWWAGTGPGEYASSLVIDTNDAPTHWQPLPAAPVTDPAS